jgi:hypothetical protein
MNEKIKNCCLIDGELKKESKEVKFSSISFYENATFDNFINLIKKEDLYIEFRIGVYKSGEKKGTAHDHGTSFRVNKNDFVNLFTKN